MKEFSVKPELVAPAGNLECARAAIANGADAVYFGLSRFNARMRAENFSLEELPKFVEFLHQQGVRAFTTLNILIFTDELEEAENLLIRLDEAGVDAVIVQDLGIAALAQKLGLRMAVHGSTQMTLVSPEGIQFAEKLGLKRVVLARETSLREMARFKEMEMPLEVFVHGALCVAYSGQCLTSEALGQRSANRGECAQACRLPYQLVVDGIVKDLGDRRYLLSPQDLAAVQEIPELIKLGIRGFKIEGRLKSPEYVAATTQVYRKAIDAAWEKQEMSVSKEDQYQLEMTFSRGLFSGWMHGVNHQKLVHARYGKKRGAFAGLIRQVGMDFVEIDPECHLAPGDGVVFDEGGDTDQEQGGAIYEIQENRLFFENRKINFSRLRPGVRVWKTSDPRLSRTLQKTYQTGFPSQKIPLHLTVKGSAGTPLILEWNGGGEQRMTVSVTSSSVLQKAEKRPLTDEYLKQQLGRLGDTPFEWGTLRNELQGEVMVPVSELNRMRRELVQKIPTDGFRMSSPKSTVQPQLAGIKERIAKSRGGAAGVLAGSSKLLVLCRTMDQVSAALKQGVETLYVDFEDIRRYPEVVSRIREAGSSRVFLATPRIQKSGEQGFFKLIENAKPDGVLIRNLGALSYFRGSSLGKVGDFSLNVANPITAELLIREGLDRVTISYDLNAKQVSDLLQAAPPSWFELSVHQHMPMFHMEHCVFAAFLSEGTDHTNCGRPCDRHRLQIRDRMGVDHPIKADVGCRNTVFHARAQSGADFLKSFMNLGARFFRVELLEEDAESTGHILRSYQELLKGVLEPAHLVSRLKVVKQLGVTSGTLTVLH